MGRCELHLKEPDSLLIFVTEYGSQYSKTFCPLTHLWDYLIYMLF